MKDFDYGFGDFLNDFSSDFPYRQLKECDEEIEKMNKRIDTIRKRKQKLGIGYYFVRTGFRMRRAIKLFGLDDQQK